MEHTEYYQLSLWEQDDRIQMEDFNSDNAKIDAALAEMPRIATGTYTGTGEYGAEHPNTLTFDFAPKLIIIRRSDSSYLNQTIIFRGMTTARVAWSSGGEDNMTVSWSNDGKTISWYANSASIQLNTTMNNPYYYVAIG